MTLTRHAVLDAIRRTPAGAEGGPTGAITATLTPPAYEGVRDFHVGCDVLTVATVWALQWRRRPAARKLAGV